MELDSLVAALQRPRNRILRGQLADFVPPPAAVATVAALKPTDLQSAA